MKKSKRVKKSNSWKIKQHRDQFFKKSKVLGYRSRASFKLIELNDKFKFIKENSKLLDLGSSPGGWAQVASKIITRGKIMSVDIKPMKKLKNVEFVNSDIFAKQTKENIFFLTTTRKEKFLKTTRSFTDKKLSRLFLQIISKQDILTLLVDIPTC